jgi:hypothetical protein
MPVIIKVLAVTAQLPVALKFTGRPELAVALKAKGGSPKLFDESGAKVIVCPALRMLIITEAEAVL